MELALKAAPQTKAPACWIIAYGNPQCGENRIGPFLVDALRRHLEQETHVGLCCLPRLDLALIEEVRQADHLVFVNTCTRSLDATMQWSLVEPDADAWGMGSHYLDPNVLLGLLATLFDHRPSAWMITVPGYDFGLGKDPTPVVRRRAGKAVTQIMDWLSINGIIDPDRP